MGLAHKFSALVRSPVVIPAEAGIQADDIRIKSAEARRRIEKQRDRWTLLRNPIT